MKCFYCGHPNTKVINSRPNSDGTIIKRRRECEACKRRFTTFETVEEVIPYVIKKDGKREEFNRSKLKQSILTACKKTGITIEEIDNFVENFLSELQFNFTKEITSKEIGEKVIKFLKEHDKVAYIRYASVYWEFKDVEQFLKEINNLKES